MNSPTPPATGRGPVETQESNSAVAALGAKGRSKEQQESLETAEYARTPTGELPSFAADLFAGRFDAQALLDFPLPTPAQAAEGEDFLKKLRVFLEENLDGDEVDETGEVPAKVFEGFRKLGVFGMKIPKEYGGLGLSQLSYVKALSLVAEYCNSTAGILSAHQSIGVPEPLKRFGTTEQKKRWLPKLAAGAISAFALTEPEVGSDPARLATTAMPTDDGKHWIINGTKLWCSNGVIADLIVVMARTPDRAPAANSASARPAKRPISAFVVDMKTPGIKILHRCRFMGLSGFQNAVIEFKDVKIPADHLLLGEGKGLRLALTTLNTGRLSVPMGCIAAIRGCLRRARGWGATRRQWGAAIGAHEAGAAKIADLSATLLSMEAMSWLACGWSDRGNRDLRLEAAMVKLYTSTRSHACIDSTLQLLGGRGYERASSLKARGEEPFPVERLLRDSRINQIIEGTTEIMGLYIGREALDFHLKLAGPALDPRRGLIARAASALKAGATYAFWYPWQWVPRERFRSFRAFGPGARMALQSARLARHVALALFHQMLRHGPGLERRQLQLLRLTEAATGVFALAATAGYVHALHAAGESPEIGATADVFLRHERARIEGHLKSVRSRRQSKTDAADRKLAAKILEGKLAWQETLR
ncbi:MAG: acyl-CoA dehydrogenase family protein [Bdellovibrionales bacterium]|nr:acyl-CoA dehydrogenase family protein [Bdellovibrionales bacterium]